MSKPLFHKSVYLQTKEEVMRSYRLVALMFVSRDCHARSKEVRLMKPFDFCNLVIPDLDSPWKWAINVLLKDWRFAAWDEKRESRSQATKRARCRVRKLTFWSSRSCRSASPPSKSPLFNVCHLATSRRLAQRSTNEVKSADSSASRQAKYENERFSGVFAININSCSEKFGEKERYQVQWPKLDQPKVRFGDRRKSTHPTGGAFRTYPTFAAEWSASKSSFWNRPANANNWKR